MHWGKIFLIGLNKTVSFCLYLLSRMLLWSRLAQRVFSIIDILDSMWDVFWDFFFFVILYSLFTLLVFILSANISVSNWFVVVVTTHCLFLRICWSYLCIFNSWINKSFQNTNYRLFSAYQMDKIIRMPTVSEIEQMIQYARVNI